MKIKWTGKRTLKGGYLDIGRFRFAYRGWMRRISPPIKIGDTRLTSFGPLAVFISPRTPRTILDAIHENRRTS